MKCAIAGLIGAVLASAIFGLVTNWKPKGFLVGSKFSELETEMTKASYEKTQPAMGADGEQLRMEHWIVGGETLNVIYNWKSDSIVSMSYRLSGEGPRRKRTQFDLTVRRFEPVSNVMEIEPNEESR